VFYSWENSYGRDMYDIHWKITQGFYKTEAAANFLIKPLLDKNKTEEADISEESSEREYTELGVAPDTSVIPKSNLGFFKRLFLKLYGLTYMLEFILITRFMADLFIHTSFNIFSINYSYEFSQVGKPGNKKTTFFLVSNILVSVAMLSTLSWEMCRFLNRNGEFAKDDEAELEELIKENLQKQKEEKETSSSDKEGAEIDEIKEIEPKEVESSEKVGDEEAGPTEQSGTNEDSDVEDNKSDSSSSASDSQVGVIEIDFSGSDVSSLASSEIIEIQK
jgi:hypothetical protein